MRIEAISIFPEYFSPLSLSLIGKAQENGVLSFQAVDLREFTHDPHRTVDDTPYGGGAGMVMKPEPWGEAIDARLSQMDGVIDLIILTPAGRVFDQRYAEELSKSENIIFACGRYEGIDARVEQYYRDVESVRVHEISIGNYVLNGGEVAALAIIESIVRLIPGVIGNPESLSEESHNEIGEVEYPVYTKPAQWRGINVPEILTSGNHGAIARWRQEEAKRRSQR
ncbi:MAG: tRNA (guanosine(37)-N1)-methyltransferase TrmD [Actinobacteria bacterium]|jgi:tRNA (guanine37-N1)-methyltransferase|nr:tRNA (guanosine(37)-N1)-methyltransferase TrmD [Actinomycetota bacterium]NCZ73338.1 tRNA (guanosine(37)-N1)-methyltransferase TrmD [Actinomycetota bacterium]NDA41221.1 tRNA (guanosine(37)-N1)-methyltransferase TrmD [Actinomycetota bacterium]NDB30860.1 tRNA (guanosine(37)-N1)-methyltransferase TrmD [Actinomycetota bacterium]NDD59713.1 tRNA (guanosine(37)-N1)-methyltransferase TrmD [Actinomycetota bacterium]